MTALLLRLTIGALLIVHGFAHWQITRGWGRQATAQSGMLNSVGMAHSAIEVFGTTLWVVTLLTFIASGTALMFGLDWWWPLAIGAAVISLLTIVLYWQPVMILGALVDLGVIGWLLAAWPSTRLVGP